MERQQTSAFHSKATKANHFLHQFSLDEVDNTLPPINMEPDRGPLSKENGLPGQPYQVPCSLVGGLPNCQVFQVGSSRHPLKELSE